MADTNLKDYTATNLIQDDLTSIDSLINAGFQAEDAVDFEQQYSAIPSSYVLEATKYLSWVHTLTLSATDADTVAWTSGTITFRDNSSLSIAAGNTGNMAALTYIYLDIDVSSTSLQTSTTKTDAIGERKILLAAAQNGTTTATFTTFFSKEAGLGWSQVTDDDGNKPENNATVGGTMGTDIKDSAALTPAQDLIVNYKTFTTGEAITAGNVVCIKPSYMEINPSADSYTNSNAANSNFGTADQMFFGQEANGLINYNAFLKFSMTTVPSAENILKAELTLYKRNYTGTSPNTVTLNRVSSADWDENTITWNNQPTSTNDVGGVYGAQATQTIQNNSTSITFDVTHMIRQWKEAAVNNYGFQLSIPTMAGDVIGFSTKEWTTKPTLRIYKTDTSDGLIYKASNDDYNLCRSVIGFALDTANTGYTSRVQYQSIASSLSIGGDATGGKLFLDTAGGYNISTNNMTRMVQVGKVFSNSQACVDIVDRDIEIESTVTALSGTTSARTFYAPVDTRYVLIWIQDTSAAGPEKMIKSFRCGVSNSFTDSDAYTGTSYDITISWGANFITLTPGIVTYIIKKVSFYT